MYEQYELAEGLLLGEEVPDMFDEEADELFEEVCEVEPEAVTLVAIANMQLVLDECDQNELGDVRLYATLEVVDEEALAWWDVDMVYDTRDDEIDEIEQLDVKIDKMLQRVVADDEVVDVEVVVVVIEEVELEAQ